MNEDQSKALTNASDRPEILVKAAVPEMYRKNAFRILGLSVDATPQQIKRREQEYATYIKMGLTPEEIAEQFKSLIPLNPLPDEDTVRQAFQRLRDPESRLLDEFFWFWPTEGTSTEEDKAMSILRKGSYQDVISYWVTNERELSETMTTVHNLAVMFHLLALDMEIMDNSNPLDQKLREQKQVYWKLTYTRWKECLARSGLWNRLSRRIAELDDPRLTGEIPNQFRTALPKSLLQINAALAVRAAQKGNRDEAVKQITTMENSGFNKEWIRDALNVASSPIRERIKTMCDAFDSQMQKDEEHLNVTAQNLINQTAPMLFIMDTLLPADHLSRQAVHDEVALKAMLMLIYFSNKTSNWTVAVAMLEKVLQIASSASAKQRIEKNISIMKSNIEIGTCWFCKSNPSVDTSTVSVKMYGNVVRTPTWQNTVHVTWNQLTLSVPRCKHCEKAHKHSDAIAATSSVIAGIIGVFPSLAIAKTMDDSGFCGFIFIMLLCLGLGYGIGSAIGKATLPKGVSPVSVTNDYPSVKEKLNSGWKLGDKPENVQ